MGPNSAITQEASYETVRYALAILMFISLCSLLYFASFMFFRVASIDMGAPYVKIGTIAPS